QLLGQAGQRREMYEHLEAAVALGEQVLQPDDHNLAAARSSLGMALAEDGKVDRALELIGKAGDAWTRSGSPFAAGAFERRGEILQDRNRFAEAVPLFEQAVAGFERSHVDAKGLLVARFNLALCLWESKLDRKRAYTMMREVERDAAALGEGARNVAAPA